MIHKRHPKTVLLLLTLMLLAIAIVSIDLGMTRMSFGQTLAALVGRGEWIDNLIVFDLRLPRIVMSILIGIGVATSGVILQGMTQNDLAGPDTVGVNAGSGLGMMFLLIALVGTSWPQLRFPLVCWWESSAVLTSSICWRRQRVEQ